MNNILLENFLGKRGQIVSLKWKRPVKTLKSAGNILIEKEVSMQARAGVNYENMESTKEGRADGSKPETNQGLPWGKWAVFPHVIEHKDNYYFRFSFLPGQHTKSQFFLNGKPVEAEQVKEFCLASEFAERNEPLTVFNVKEENLLELV